MASPISERLDDDTDETDGALVVRPLILVVDDDAAVREALELLLEHSGYDVALAEDGAEALDAMADGPLPSLVVLDLMMPVMSGWEALERMRASPVLAGIPVVVFTATGLPRGSMGDAPILSKTSDTRAILDTIAQLLRAD